VKHCTYIHSAARPIFGLLLAISKLEIFFHQEIVNIPEKVRVGFILNSETIVELVMPVNGNDQA
jgi:hypothetical protein